MGKKTIYNVIVVEDCFTETRRDREYYQLTRYTCSPPQGEVFDENYEQQDIYNLDQLAQTIVGEYYENNDFQNEYESLGIRTKIESSPQTMGAVFDFTDKGEIDVSYLERPLNYSEMKALYKMVYSELKKKAIPPRK
ncbi:MAG: hypothetical protein Q8R37_04290 [Nanoarchaeota archaeon]|nr:hypothetical protein [Nanoarchaeota archaeon]